MHDGADPPQVRTQETGSLAARRKGFRCEPESGTKGRFVREGVTLRRQRRSLAETEDGE